MNFNQINLKKMSALSGLISIIVILYYFTISSKFGVLSNMVKQDSSLTIKTAIAFKESIKKIDPLRVKTLTEAMLLRHLFSSIVDYDNSGQIVASIAESFQWNNNQLIFTFGNKVILPNGKPVTANDAATSLKRIMKDRSNLHGDLKQMLCPDYDIKDLNSECPGLKVDGNKLIITPADHKYQSWLLPLLATVDFRVISADSIDKQTLEIIDFHNTTGPYTFISESEFEIKLKANHRHFLYDKMMPQEILIKRIEGPEIFNLFIDGNINLIPSTGMVSLEQVKAIRAKSSNFIISTGYRITISMVQFSKRAIKELSVADRFEIGHRIENSREFDINFDEAPNIQFFQSFGERFLSKAQENEIVSLRKNLPKFTGFSRKPTVGSTKKFLPRLGGFYNNNPDINSFVSESSVQFLPDDQKPDAFMIYTDTSFNEDLGHISYNLKKGSFGIFGKDADNWLSNYIATENKDERLKMLSDLHFEALKNCYIYPISAFPAVVVSSDDWQVNMNKYFAATRIWQMRHN